LFLIYNLALPLLPKEIPDYDKLIDFCKNQKIDLVIVGPEEHLEKGIVETLTASGINCFGPTAQAAKLEVYFVDI